MKTNTILFLVTGSVLAVSHYLSLEFALYWRYLWLDIPVHFIGGVAAVLGLWTLRDLRTPLPRFIYSFWFVSIFLLLVIIAWEIFEWKMQIAVIAEGYTADTISDILMGLSGGLLGYIMGKLNYE